MRYLLEAVILVEHFNGRTEASLTALEGSPVGLALYVENVDDVFKRAVNAGASIKEPVSDKFWGDRVGSLTDPFGHRWMVLTHIEDVPADEMKKRMEESFSMAEHRK